MKEGKLDIKQLIGKAVQYWYLFLIFLVAALVANYFYLARTPPKFESRSLLLIKDEKTAGQVNEEAIFQDLGLLGNRKNLENEILLLKSTPLMRKVVDNLQLQNECFKIGRYRRYIRYNNPPIKILNWKPIGPETKLDAIIEVDQKGGFTLQAEESVFQGEFGKVLRLPTGYLTLALSRELHINGPYAIVIWPKKLRAKKLVEKLEVELRGSASSTLRIAIRDESPHRARDLIRELITVYNEQSINEKNTIYANSIDLINERVQLITQELSAAEQQVESYKRRFNTMELSAEGNMLLSEISEYNKNISQTEVQLQILDSIQGFLHGNRENFEYVPTNLNLNNLTLSGQISNFNELLNERVRLQNELGEAHPDLVLTEKQIQNLRETIIENIGSLKDDVEINRDATLNLKNQVQSRIQTLPRRERELIEMERQKLIKENLYLYLLQKREESILSLSVTTSNGKVIEPAEASGKPVSPMQAQMWLIAAFLGLAIPSGIILLLESLNDKIRPEDYLENITSVPVAGMLASYPFKNKKEKLVIKENSRSVLAEMFRLLRVNLAYIQPDQELKSLLITSSMQEEGKSFIALNLAMTQAMAGKKVLLLELDLRKPKLRSYANLKKQRLGITDYLTGQSITSSKIIQNSGLHPDLDLIICGTKPPNPGELLLSLRLRNLMNELKKRYDFIIIDAPPVGMVSDPLLFKDLVEASMYVVRIGKTRKSQLQIIEDIAKNKKLPNPFIVVNGVQLKRSGYGYKYGYSYSSSNGYYEAPTGYRIKGINNLKSIFKHTSKMEN